VDDLARSYIEGSTLEELARRYSVHRTTVIRHLDGGASPAARTTES
jgi:hypothetical protein